jgi:four helix bundle protein
MAIFKKFKEILAWQKARIAARKVYQATSGSEFARDFALRDQIRRSSISIMANIAEGHGRSSNKEFANFLNFARGSAMETPRSRLFKSGCF